jgi:hypothetical protein
MYYNFLDVAELYDSTKLSSSPVRKLPGCRKVVHTPLHTYATPTTLASLPIELRILIYKSLGQISEIHTLTSVNHDFRHTYDSAQKDILIHLAVSSITTDIDLYEPLRIVQARQKLGAFAQQVQVYFDHGIIGTKDVLSLQKILPK